MSKFLLTIIICLQIAIFYQNEKIVDQNWWNDEYEIMRTQISDLWFFHGLDKQ